MKGPVRTWLAAVTLLALAIGVEVSAAGRPKTPAKPVTTPVKPPPHAPDAPTAEHRPDAGLLPTRVTETQPVLPGMSAASHANTGGTQCISCHSTAGWSPVQFNHEKTGFALKGKHARVTCKSCHAHDFTSELPMSCVGCHRDIHGGQLGARCESCHDEKSWQPLFSADAHRRSTFPLIGAHATIPCVECHSDARDRQFSRPAVTCAACHQADITRTRGTAVDHVALNFTAGCETCHLPTRFTPARFPQHDLCFVLSAGPHSVLSCTQCHTSLPTTASPAGTCRTGTASCTGCHEHQCMGPGSMLPTDARHANVAGYACKDRKCFECHLSGGITK